MTVAARRGEATDPSLGRQRGRAPVVVVGGGQAGLAVGYYLRGTGLPFVILDAQDGPGGAWPHAWDSLRLLSPVHASSLPGWPMQGAPGYCPTRDETVEYLRQYAERYRLPVERPVRVGAVRREGDHLRVETDGGELRARAVVSATGTWENPYVPAYPGRERFRGIQLHSARYRSPGALAGMRVLVVGGGNSGAQILAEVSREARATWVTLSEPRFQPEEGNGHQALERAGERYRRWQGGQPTPESSTTLEIAQVPAVREARERGALLAVRPFERFTERGVAWPGGREEAVDAVVWCTGYGPALDHLRPLGVVERDGRVALKENRSVLEPRLWLVGYGDWTGFGSALLIGAGGSARTAVAGIVRAARAAT